MSSSTPVKVARRRRFWSPGNLSLGSKIILLTSVGLLAGAAALSYLGLKATNEATQIMLEDRFTTADVVADYLDESLQLCLDILERSAGELATPEGMDEVGERMVGLWSTYTTLSVYVDSIYLIDNGDRVAWSNPPVEAGAASVLATGVDGVSAPGVSSAVISPATGSPVVLLSAVVGKYEQSPVGYLVVAVDLTSSGIAGFIRPLRLGKTGYVEIVDCSGTVVARTEPGPKLTEPFEKSDHSGHFSALIALGEPTRGLCHNCHSTENKVVTRDVLAFIPLETAPWGVVIRQAEHEALAPVRRLQRDLGFSVLVIVAFVFILAVVTTRDIVSRIKSLTAASQRIAEGNFDARIISSRTDEVGTLAETLDNMRSRLKTSYAETERRSRELASLLSVSEALAALPQLADFTRALTSALERTIEIIGVEVGAVLVGNDEHGALHFMAALGLPIELAASAIYRVADGDEKAPAGDRAPAERLVRATGETLDDDLKGLGLRAALIVPLPSKPVSGLLVLAGRDERVFSGQDVRLVEGIARYVATAMENTRLHQEVQQKEMLRGELLRDMLAVQEEERRRIARELHDETSQLLASLTANIEAAISSLPADSDRAVALLKKVQAMSVNVLDSTNSLIYQLRPSLLDDMGLVAALRWLGNNNLKPVGVAATLVTRGRKRRLSRETETAIFRVVQETFNNVVRHARAKNVKVTLHFLPHEVRVSIGDNGIGFDVDEAIHTTARPRGLGLLGMKERIEIVGGTITVQSRRGQGTQINIQIPDEKEAAHGQDEGSSG